MPYRRIILLVLGLALLSLACRATSGQPQLSSTLAPTETRASSQAPTPRAPAATPTRLPSIPVQAGEDHPDEPVFITGEIPYTSPFFVNSLSAPFVLLEDQAGFVRRDRNFQFALPSQVIGPVSIDDDDRLTYSLALPTIPQGTLVDVDNNGQTDTGIQVFAIAYWSNTWGDPFLEERDGTGWSTAYSSTITDSENKDEIKGGTLLVWAPDEQQGFPTSFGPDGLLFTEDDPTALIPAGYSLVDLEQEPFRVYKETRPEITLHEGEIAVNDYSGMDYAEAFEALYQKVSREYPFTAEKDIDWQALYAEIAPRAQRARGEADFYRAVRDFAFSIPDAHVGMTLNPQVFFQEYGGGLGLVLAELSQGQVIVTEVLPDLPGANAGIQPGAEILTWNSQPVAQAIAAVRPGLENYSTEHTRRLGQVTFLTRMPADTQVNLSFRNPGGQVREVTLRAEMETDSLFRAMPGLAEDPLLLPVEARVLEDSGFAYVRISTFSDDYNLMAGLWTRYIETLIDSDEIPGLIIDVRQNGGGSGGLAQNFAEYFFDEEVVLYRSAYFNDRLDEFEYRDEPVRLQPAPLHYERPVAVLIGPDCVSACEGFAYAMQQGGRAILVGHFPTAGAFGEVGRGQYTLPDDIRIQFPTGRPETMDGELLIEGSGVAPDITVPVTAESARGEVDAVLDAAIEALR